MRSRARRRLAGPDLAPIAEARAKGALGDLSTGRTEDTTGAVVNIGFGIGRDDGARAAVAAAGDGDTPLVAKIYSAVLDDFSCEECARWDGATFPIDYDSSAPGAVKAPNPKCAGTIRRCRCIWVYVHADEAPTIIGPTAGPLADPRYAPGSIR
jgi:hypothetical protein